MKFYKFPKLKKNQKFCRDMIFFTLAGSNRGNEILFQDR